MKSLHVDRVYNFHGRIEWVSGIIRIFLPINPLTLFRIVFINVGSAVSPHFSINSCMAVFGVF